MQIFSPNRLWRFLKYGHLPVKLHSSAPPGCRGVLIWFTSCWLTNKLEFHIDFLVSYQTEVHSRRFVSMKPYQLMNRRVEESPLSSFLSSFGTKTIINVNDLRIHYPTTQSRHAEVNSLIL